MNNIGGEAWFPITGALILRENKPILSTHESKIAYELMPILAAHYKGTTFTCITSNGWHCEQEADKQ